MKFYSPLRLVVLTALFGVLATASMIAGTAKPPLAITIDECPKGAPLPYSYEVLEDRSRDGTYDTRIVFNCAGEFVVRAIPGATVIKQGQVPQNEGTLTMEFSSAVCEIDAYSWNINFKNSNNITVATMGRNCNDEWYDTGMTELSGLLSNPLHQLLAIATQAQGSVLVGQSGSVLIPSQQ